MAPIAYHHMWDQFNKQNLIYRFMGPLWQLAKTLASEFHVFLSQWQFLLCQSDFTIYPLLPEAIFDRWALLDTAKQAQHSWQSFPLHIYGLTD